MFLNVSFVFIVTSYMVISIFELFRYNPLDSNRLGPTPRLTLESFRSRIRGFRL